MEKEITSTLSYFAHFKYAPTFDEVFVFLPKKSTKKTLLYALNQMILSKKALCHKGYYTLGEYSKNIDKTIRKQGVSRIKKELCYEYIKKLSTLPFIRLIGLSGSVAMENASNNDDVDIFIISEANRMWITRLYALFLAQIMGKRRRREDKKAVNKICLNLFIDESDLGMPEDKRTFYVAHEILQMKPIFERNSVYKKFLTANVWVFDFFPNAQKIYIKIDKRRTKHNKTLPFLLWVFVNILEHVSKYIQLILINKHRTSERITDTQLWFFPRDYEKKIKL